MCIVKYKYCTKMAEKKNVRHANIELFSAQPHDNAAGSGQILNVYIGR